MRIRTHRIAVSLCLLAMTALPATAFADEGNHRIAPLTLPQPEGHHVGASCTYITSTFDIEVPRILLTGAFSVNNAVPLTDPAHSGRVELRHETLGTVDLGSVHTGGYTRYIIPGTYDVVYRHMEGDILPQNAETVLFEEVDLTADGTFDIAIESVLVWGDITLDGATPPSSLYEQGRLHFRDRATGATFPVGNSRDGQYFAMVIPGSYDILYSHTMGSMLPLGHASVLSEEITIAGATQLHVDIPTVERTGDLLLDGAAPPSSQYENGQLSLRNTQTGDVFELGQTRDQTYSVRVVPGVYDVIYTLMLGSSIMPANTFAVVAEGLDFTQNGDHDINITTVRVVGDLTLDGGAFPASIYNRARFWLQGSQEEGDLFAIGTTAEPDYAIRLVPGSYNLIYEAMLASGSIPENRWSVVSSGHKLSKPKGIHVRPQIAFNIDITTGWLGVEVTIWGETPPASQYENGLLLADDAFGDPVDLGYTRDGGGDALLLAAPYDVRYSLMLGSTQVPTNGNAHVATANAEPAGTPLTIDLQPGWLSGDFSQNGFPFPGNAMHRGRLVLLDKVTGDEIELGHTASGNYEHLLLGGTYKVIYEHVIGHGVVANDRAMLGCITFDPPAPSTELIWPATKQLTRQ
ncbi:MAG: hypothetical protein AAFS10_12260 [Myxococcota bacterium]